MNESKRGTAKPPFVDPDEAPELTAEDFARGDWYIGEKLIRRGRPPVDGKTKEAVSLRLSSRVLDHFRATGPGWQTRINEILEGVVARAEGKPAARRTRAKPSSDAAPASRPARGPAKGGRTV